MGARQCVIRLSAALALAGCGGPGSGAEASSEGAPADLALTPPTIRLESGGLRLEEQSWRRGDEAGLAWRVSVALPGHASVSAVDSVADFSALLPQDAGPWAAINGGFYDVSRAAMGLVVSAGQERAPLQKSGGSGIFFVGPTGPGVVHRDAWVSGPSEALQSIDRLIDQGASLVQRLGGPKAARSAVVVGRERLWIVALAASTAAPGASEVTLDHTIGHGLTLGVFAQYLLQSTDAVAALNLDGAVSTQLSVVTPDGRLDVHGERGTINAVVLRP